MVAESPRWLLRRGRKDAAYAALLRSRSLEQADLELKEMEDISAAETGKTSVGTETKESLRRRKYVIPFVLACVILACTQATGVNSIIAYNINILSQSGLSDVAAHWGYVAFTIVNFIMTFVGVTLVDRKGRKFLLTLGTAGIMASLICAGVLFLSSERQRADSKDAVQSMVTPQQELTLRYNEEQAGRLLRRTGSSANTEARRPTSLVVIYSYGDFRAATKVVRSDDIAAQAIEIRRESCVPSNKVIAFFTNPFANLDASRTAELRIDNALIGPVPDARHGWLVAITLLVFMSFYAVGPGVCVWLALSELMPTRIRSNGMSIALVLNQAVSTTIAAIFLPTVGKHGYSSMFFGFAACTMLYFVTATRFLPETKGKTLEEIEAYFSGPAPPVPLDARTARRPA
jgi:MFS family permease